jgi:exodeoxyribonuclease V beta subunit
MNPLEIGLNGTQLIEASAGTGKTHTITTLYLRLLLEESIPVENLLVVTYTNAATAELRDRIRRRLVDAHLACGRPDEVLPPSETELRALLGRRLGQADEDRRRLNLALQSFDEAPILTIHGFCQGLLQDNAFETGAAFECELMIDESALREEILNDFWISKLHDADDLLLSQLAKDKLSPTTLFGLARQAMGNPDLRILPERAELSSPEGDSSWRKAFDAVASTSRDELVSAAKYVLRNPDRRDLHRARRRDLASRAWSHNSISKLLPTDSGRDSRVDKQK